MRFLYVPDEHGSVFFLWGAVAGETPSRLVRELKRRGKRATMTVVDASLRLVDVSGAAIPLAHALPLLAVAVGREEGELASVAAWVRATAMAVGLVTRGRMVPRCDVNAVTGGVARWQVHLGDGDDAARAEALAMALPYAAFAMPVAGVAPRRGERIAVYPASRVLHHFLHAAVDVMVREGVRRERAASKGARVTSRVSRRARKMPEGTGDGERAERWIGALTGSVATMTLASEQERLMFNAVNAWTEAPTLVTRGVRCALRLDVPEEGDRFPLTLSVASVLGADAAGCIPESVEPVFQDAVLVAERLFAPCGLLKVGTVDVVEGMESTISLTPAEAWTFMTVASAQLSAAGFQVMIPSVFARAGERRLRLRMRVGAPPAGIEDVASPAQRLPSALGDVCGFQWEAALGETSLTAEEFARLAESQAPLVRWRGAWVVIEPRHVRAIQALVGTGGTLPVAEALRAALSDEPGRALGAAVDEAVLSQRAGESIGASTDAHRADARDDGHPEGSASGLRTDRGDLTIDVRADDAVATLLARITNSSTNGVEPTDIDTSALVGTLRPYQERGVRWLATLSTVGLGGCLADDMGLGKTVQVLALLLHLRTRGAATSAGWPSLIVCPTSVAGNWEREAHRFAPFLPVVAHYGAGRATSAEILAERSKGAIVVTTYPVLRRDAALLRQITWQVLVLDEAQQIKNSAAQVSTAARALRAAHRFALTGTPVENRLADLWSILQVTTPGLLGSAAAFKRAYTVPIEKYGDMETASRLRRVIAPFVLRRVKTDPAIITDLPPKQEREVICTLTEEQASLYQAVVDDAMQTIVTSAGMTRKGHVLALITALKQICNHPSQYLRDGGVSAGRSGKLARLGEMLDEVAAAGEGDRALVFTQFRDMGDRLVEYLQSRLECPIQYLHGGTPQATRTRLVEQFQDETGEPMVFVLSLKAGGTGLNLTAASHVFHFDRWWNPAVEDQATDRAYRIGQTKPVQVHKLVTAGTIEENIARVMGEKRALSQQIVGAGGGERWITELDSSELRELVTLSATRQTVDAAEDVPNPVRQARTPVGPQAGRKGVAEP